MFMGLKHALCFFKRVNLLNLQFKCRISQEKNQGKNVKGGADLLRKVCQSRSYQESKDRGPLKGS